MKIQAIELLGHKVVDKVTGMKGVVTSISFDLYGCIQAVITPAIDEKELKPREGHWYDVQRLKVTSREPVMAVPTFSVESGPERKPIPHGRIV
jgi:hypothetical protein